MSKGNNILTPKESKRLTRYAWIFLILSLVGMALHGMSLIYYKFNPKSPAELAHQYAKDDPYKITKHVRISGVDYDIPVGYFATMVPYATEDLGIYLVVMKPDFTILPKSESKLWKEGQRDKILRILAHDPMHIKTMDGLANFVFKDTHYSVKSRNRFGLETYKLALGVDGNDQGEPFMHKNNEHYVTVIQCDNDVIKGLSVPSWRPGCDHYFSDGYLIYRVHYPKVFLNQWKDIEDKTKVLFKGFRQAARKKRLDQVAVPPERVEKLLKERRNKPINPDFKPPQGEE